MLYFLFFPNCDYRFLNKKHSGICIIHALACCIFNVPNKNLAKQDKLSQAAKATKNEQKNIFVCRRVNVEGYF